MAEETNISWTDSTLNFWRGCQKVSAGCDNCYAEALDERFGGAHWGPRAVREPTTLATRRSAIRGAKKAANGRRGRTFVGSMMDWADNKAPEQARADMWDTIRQNQDIDFQLLTKRPQNITRYLPEDWGEGYPNVWLGVTVENRAEGLPRVDILREIPAAVRFLSCEPLLEDLGEIDLGGIDWVIAGAESGRGARPCNLDWARSVRDQCTAGSVAFHFKQWVDRGRKIHAPALDGRQWVEFP